MPDSGGLAPPCPLASITDVVKRRPGRAPAACPAPHAFFRRCRAVAISERRLGWAVVAPAQPGDAVGHQRDVVIEPVAEEPGPLVAPAQLLESRALARERFRHERELRVLLPGREMVQEAQLQQQGEAV